MLGQTALVRAAVAHGLRRRAGRWAVAARSAEAMASRAQGSICAGDSIASSGALHQASTVRLTPADV